MKNILCLLLILSSPLTAKTAGGKVAEAFYEGLSMAVEIKFADALVSHRSKDFKGIDEFGRLRTNASDLNRFRRLFAESVAVHCKIKMEEISGDADSVVCRVEQQWDYSIRLESDLPKLRVIREKWLLEETWQQQSGEWRLAKSIVRSRTLPTW